MKKPILLTKEEVLKPIKETTARIESIRHHKTETQEPIILQGLFILAISSFEICINDTIRTLLTHFPEKLESSIEAVSKEDLIDGTVLEKVIKHKVNSIAYKNINKVLDYFAEVAGISFATVPNKIIDQLKEIKASRNLLVHNNLKVNSIYLETAGSLIRETSLDKQLEIDQEYLFRCIALLQGFLSLIEVQLGEKYKKYTHVNAVKNLWKYMFPNVLIEMEFIIDEKNDIIHGYNEKQSRRADFSSSEEMKFSLWLSHFQSRPIRLDHNFFRLDNQNREKIAYFISVVDLIKARSPKNDIT